MRYETGVAIGRGASAEVFKAWDPKEQRYVALKLFAPGDGEAARREREIEAQASLEHPSICRIYEVGETPGGQPFIAMQFVDGEPFDEVCRRLPVIRRAELVLQIAEAVGIAHEAGLVHRDLKPGNALVEEQEDGSLRAYVLDFGLVRFAEATRLTETGQVLGTPGYLSPEQARGDQDLDARSDVFSLGVMLYQVLTGVLPFESSSPVGAIMRVLEEDPPLAQEVRDDVPPELGHIAQKAMEKDPRRRYADAGALARDLRRSLVGGATEARGVGLFGRWLRRVERHPNLWAAGLLLSLLALASLGWGLRGRLLAEQLARDAEVFARRATEIEAQARYHELLPRHSIAEARTRLAEQIDELRGDVAASRGRAAAAGQFALGRAELALGRTDRALEHLGRAREAGFDDPEWRFDWSRALLDQARSRLRGVELLREPEQRRIAREQILQELRDRLPALETSEAALLGLGRGDQLMAGALEALLGARPEKARRLAEQLIGLEPWRIEADLLIADLHREAASAAFRGDEKTRTGSELESERTRLRAAIERAPSSLVLHRRLAENRLSAAQADLGIAADPEQWEASFAAAESALDAALEILPADLRTRSLRTELEWRRTLARLRENGPGGLVEPTREASRGARALLEDPSAGAAEYRNLGNALYAEAEVLRELDQADAELYEESAEMLARSLELDPGLSLNWHSLGLAWYRHARVLIGLDRDPRESFRRAVDAYERSRGGVRYHESRSQNAACLTWTEVAYYGMTHREGTTAREVEEALTAAGRACDRALELAPDYTSAQSNLALLEWTWVDWQIAEGQDPGEAYARSLEAFARLFELAPEHVSGRINLGGLVAAMARWRLDESSPSQQELEDALLEIAEARGRIEPLAPRFPYDVNVQLARLDIAAAAARCRLGDPQGAFERARASVSKLGETGSLANTLRARFHRRSGACLAASDPSTAVEQVRLGLARVKIALDSDPGNAEALAERGRLEELQQSLR